MANALNKTPPTRMTLREAQAAASQTDWQRLNSMTDEEITRAAEEDADNPSLDDSFFETAHPAIYAMKMLQTAMKSEAEKACITSDEDVSAMIAEMRAGGKLG